MDGAPEDDDTHPPDLIDDPLCVEVGSPGVVAAPSTCDDVGQSCSICFERPRTVRNRPCGHAVCCGLCTIRSVDAASMRYSCPACRADVEELEWHGAAPALGRMATDGRQLSAGSAEKMSVLDFLRSRVDDGSGVKSLLAEESQRVLDSWGDTTEVSHAEAFPLVAAAEAGDADRVCTLADAGADINLPDEEGWTALMAAASEGHTEVVRALASRQGVDINARNHDRETALMRAVISGHNEVAIELLACSEIDVNACTQFGKTVLIIACSTGDALMVALLLDAPGIDVNVSDVEGETALIHAASGGHLDVVQALLEMPRLDTAKATIASKQTALMLAVEHGHSELATMLRRYNRDKAMEVAKTARSARSAAP